VRCPWDFLGSINTSRTSLVRNDERYLAFTPAVTPAVSRGTDLRDHFLVRYLSTSTSIFNFTGFISLCCLYNS
jgi:hypothetical protein